MKKYLMYLNNKTLKLYLIIAVLSSLIFCGIYGIKVLDPTYIDWLLTGGDLTEYSGLRDTGVRGFGNRHSGSQKTMIPGMETIHTMP